MPRQQNGVARLFISSRTASTCRNSRVAGLGDHDARTEKALERLRSDATPSYIRQMFDIPARKDLDDDVIF